MEEKNLGIQPSYSSPLLLSLELNSATSRDWALTDFQILKKFYLKILSYIFLKTILSKFSTKDGNVSDCRIISLIWLRFKSWIWGKSWNEYSSNNNPFFDFGGRCRLGVGEFLLIDCAPCRDRNPDAADDPGISFIETVRRWAGFESEFFIRKSFLKN